MEEIIVVIGFILLLSLIYAVSSRKEKYTNCGGKCTYVNVPLMRNNSVNAFDSSML